MPVKGQAHPISPRERALYAERLEVMHSKDKSWNQSKIAESLGVKRSAISRIFSGKAKQSPLKPRLESVLGLRQKTPTEQILKEINQIADQLDGPRRERLCERARALLDEQKSST